jgi:hypothetical protein
MPYEMGMDLQAQPMHGLPMATPQKQLAPVENLYDSFFVVQPPTVSSASFHQHIVLPTSGGFDIPLRPHVSDHGIDVANMSAESQWECLTNTAWPDANHHGYPYVDRLAQRFPQQEDNTMEDVRSMWDPSTSASFGQTPPVPSGTIIPSDAMLDDDFVQVHADGFASANGIGSADSSFPQQPQEVSFKREESIDIKEEEMYEEARVQRRMCVRSTGAKSVKRERRLSTASKKKARSEKYKNFVRTMDNGERLFVTREAIEEGVGVDIKQDENGRWIRVGGKLKEPHTCPRFVGGRTCGKVFKRPEHLKRHVRTHDKLVDAICDVCLKKFGRNDNCIAHYETHIRKPGKKAGRNTKYTLREVLDHIHDKKTAEKLRQKFVSLSGLEPEV